MYYTLKESLFHMYRTNKAKQKEQICHSTREQIQQHFGDADNDSWNRITKNQTFLASEQSWCSCLIPINVRQCYLIHGPDLRGCV